VILEIASIMVLPRVDVGCLSRQRALGDLISVCMADFLRTPLIPHTENSVDDARPMFGPLPVSDKEFVVGRMDFQSLPTWTDSLVQYLKQDPTYFVTQAKLDAEETRRRNDLAVVKDAIAEPPKQARYLPLCLLLKSVFACLFCHSLRYL